MIRGSKQSHNDKIADKLLSTTLSVKDWWSTLKTFIIPITKSSIPPLEFNINIYTAECDKANILDMFFQSQTVLNEQNATLPDLPDINRLNSHLESIVLSRTEVESVLKSLAVDKASGPNGLSNRILRELSKELSIPFCSLFNQSLRTGAFPTPYKEANVCPVPNKCDLSIVSNYRPISLLNAESKVLERLVFKYLYNHLHDNNLLSSLQSGFIPGDSTINQLTFLITLSVRHLIQVKRFGLSSATSAKHLTVSGTLVSYINFMQPGSQVKPLPGSRIIFLIGSNALFFQVLRLTGLSFVLVCRRAPF